jgi:hypothetical protein
MLKDRGVKLVGRYLWPAEYNTKGITVSELTDLRAQGITPFFIYEEDGKELVSRDAGIRVAQAAEKELGLLGLSGLPIYFNVDYNATTADLPKILASLDGIASVIGLNRTGLYAGFLPIKAAFDAGKITWGFQTYGWSLGQWDPRAQIQQWSNGQWGGSVDFIRNMVPEFGQNPVAGPPEPPIDPPLPTDDYVVTKELGDQIRTLVGEAFPVRP